jgi:hypothetical protein
MLNTFMKDDRAENSIMQTITIAVSAILIASGLVTAPGLINNARDNNAKTNLANLAYAQEYEVSDKGVYASSIATLNSGEGVRLTVDNPSRVGMLLSDPGKKGCYAAFAESASGRMFFRSCESSDAYEIPANWTATAPAGFPSSVTWPATKDRVLGNVSPNLASWNLKNGATVDPATNVLTLTNANSSAYTELIPVDNIKSFKIAFDAMLPQRLADSNKNTVVAGVSYWKADGVTPAYNLGGTEPNQGPWTANGHAVQIPGSNTWQHVTSTLGTGLTAPSPEIKYIRIDFSISPTYSQAGVKIQNPSLTVGR